MVKYYIPVAHISALLILYILIIYILKIKIF